MRYIVLYLSLAFVLTGCDRVGLPAPVIFGTNPTLYSAPPPSQARRHVTPSPAWGQTVQVKKGETVYHLSRLYNISPRSIILTNRLRAPYHLFEGQKLQIPIQQHYTVQRGDTLYGIAEKRRVSAHQLVTLNRIRSPYTIKPGQRLVLPQGQYVAAQPKRTTPKRTVTAAKPRPQIKTPPLQSGPGTFLWPLRGKLISTYGPKKGGIHNDGINISAVRGAGIAAARNGKVVYAGKDLESYGNLVLIQHDRGYITAYAHTDKIHVKRGDYVKRGQKIATVGSSGSVNRPQLHFEIRRGKQAIDPLRYLIQT